VFTYLDNELHSEMLRSLAKQRQSPSTLQQKPVSHTYI